MTYSSYENAIEIGTPVELYQFSQGTTHWYFTSGANPITRLGIEYKGAAIERNGIKQSSDIFKDSLQFTFSRGNEFAVQYIGFPPEEVTTVTVLRGHYGDPDSEFIVYWKGRVVGAKASANSIEVECESIFTSMKRPGLRMRFELQCRHTLYLAGCNVFREAYKHEGILTLGLDGITHTVDGADGQANGYYAGGILIAPGGASRFITAHTQETITISRPLAGLATGNTVAIYAGCDHTKATCLSKFNNLLNFGGFPFIPSKNPFGGSSIL